MIQLAADSPFSLFRFFFNHRITVAGE